MSTIDLVLRRVARLDEQLATRLLAWLDRQEAKQPLQECAHPLGAEAMIGFAHQKKGATPRTTATWMKELREGDED